MDNKLIQNNTGVQLLKPYSMDIELLKPYSMDAELLNTVEKYELKKMFELKSLKEVDYTRKNYNLFIKKIEFIPDESLNKDNYICDCYCLGLYYQYFIFDYQKMKKYYLIAISSGNTDAMTNFGIYYRDIKNNEILAKKYLLMGINYDNNYSYQNNAKIKEYYEKKNLDNQKYQLEQEKTKVFNSLTTIFIFVTCIALFLVCLMIIF
jgi:hypothetical protein